MNLVIGQASIFVIRSTPTIVGVNEGQSRNDTGFRQRPTKKLGLQYV